MQSRSPEIPELFVLLSRQSESHFSPNLERFAFPKIYVKTKRSHNIAIAKV